MDATYNPLQGTTFQDMWWLQRRAPSGRVIHWLNPVSLFALCGLENYGWEYVPEDKNYPVCKKCRKASEI